MKVAFISSLKANQVSSIKIETYIPANSKMLITGGLSGIDRLVEKYADKEGIAKLVFPPKMFEKMNKAVPYGRFGTMLSVADMLVIFWDGKDHTAKDAIQFAKSLGKEVIEHIL